MQNTNMNYDILFNDLGEVITADGNLGIILPDGKFAAPIRTHGGFLSGTVGIDELKPSAVAQSGERLDWIWTFAVTSCERKREQFGSESMLVIDTLLERIMKIITPPKKTD